MELLVKKIDTDAYRQLLGMDESHFVDLKAKEIAPAKLTKTVSAFCNASGGEIYVGIEEFEGVDGKQRAWKGFADPEAANAIVQVMEEMLPLGNHYSAELLAYDVADGLVFHATIFKMKDIVKASDGKVYVRRSAQSLSIKPEDEAGPLGLKAYRMVPPLVSMDSPVTHRDSWDARKSTASATSSG
jgi:ATP-dependent DNA helicase RecG